MTSIAFFTRLLDEAPPAERYRIAIEQIAHAELHGFSRAWVAQHHFQPREGGLPSPLVFLAHVAAHTTTIRLGTGVLTLPLEDPVRVAEDAAVTDLLAHGRLDLGFGSGGTPDSFAPFSRTAAEKSELYARHLATVQHAFAGGDLGAGQTLYPPAHRLAARMWQATFSVAGGARAGHAGHGLLLSRTQPRTPAQRGAPLHELQLPIVEAYLNALTQPQPAEHHTPQPWPHHPRITASRTVFVADTRAEALRFAEQGLRRTAPYFGGSANTPLPDLIRLSDTHVGTPDDVAESLAADRTLAHATEIAIQVHSVDAPHQHTLRSLELFAQEVAPVFGWGTAPAQFAPAQSAQVQGTQVQANLATPAAPIPTGVSA